MWTGTQRPFGVRDELAKAFRVPEDHVRVVMPDTGSAYGGKHTGETAIEAARLARAVKQRHYVERGDAGTAGTPAPCCGASQHSGAARSAERIDGSERFDRCSLRIIESPRRATSFLKVLGHEESRA